MSAERLFDSGANRYDALLVVSFGGPEGMADVMPFLDNVLRGLDLPEPAKRRIAARYERFGGVSPINAHTRTLISALREELDRRGPALPVYWGNRNWHPLLPDTLRQMEGDGVERALAFVTSIFGSYNGCRKYREDLYDAVRGLERPPAIDRLRYGYNHPGFIAAFAERVEEALAAVPDARRGNAAILFTAHSLPVSAARHAPYVGQLREACELVAAGLARPPARHRLVYQSRNARYGGGEWLAPDIRDALGEEKEGGATDVVVAPIGFVCDHLEVILDLDIEAKERADELGLNLIRAATVGTHPAFVSMIRDLVRERITENPVRAALGSQGPSHDFCPSGCCPSGRPGPTKPALCGHPLPSGQRDAAALSGCRAMNGACPRSQRSDPGDPATIAPERS